jgi:hypothetical protein
MRGDVMRLARAFWTALTILTVAVATSSAGETKASRAWERMKTLVGTWQGHEGDTPVSVTYSLVSNGHSLMESLTAEHDTNMITMYAPDGDSILATHYCAAGNQPRMRAKGSGGDAAPIDFRFVDAANVQDPNGEIMQRLVITIQDRDHFEQAWTSRSNGKDQTSRFVYTRKR